MTDAQLVAARQEAMKRNGMALRGAEQLTGEQAVVAASRLVETFERMPLYFRDGSWTPTSNALRRIWQTGSQFADFTTEALLVSRAMLRSAQSGDTLRYTAAVRAMGNVCSECHELFRKPASEP